MYRTFEFKKVTENVRYYFSVVGDMKANLRDRITHKPIAYLDSFDSINHWIDKLNAMSEEEYYQYIFSLGIRPQESKEADEWFLKAWIYETDKILTRLDREIPKTSQTELTIEMLYQEFKSKENKRGWLYDNKETHKEEHMEPKERREKKEEKGTREEFKAPKGKKLLKRAKKNIETPKEVQEENPIKLAPKSTQEKTKEKSATTMQEELDKLTQLKADSKITFGEYVKMKRQLIQKYGA